MTGLTLTGITQAFERGGAAAGTIAKEITTLEGEISSGQKTGASTDPVALGYQSAIASAHAFELSFSNDAAQAIQGGTNLDRFSGVLTKLSDLATKAKNGQASTDDLKTFADLSNQLAGFAKAYGTGSLSSVGQAISQFAQQVNQGQQGGDGDDDHDRGHGDDEHDHGDDHSSSPSISIATTSGASKALDAITGLQQQIGDLKGSLTSQADTDNKAVAAFQKQEATLTSALNKETAADVPGDKAQVTVLQGRLGEVQDAGKQNATAIAQVATTLTAGSEAILAYEQQQQRQRTSNNPLSPFGGPTQPGLQLNILS